MQVQAQLFCTGLSYCDFVVCLENDLHVERIEPDTSFMEEKLAKSQLLFETAVLPELLGRWFSRPLPEASTEETTSSTFATTSMSPLSVMCRITMLLNLHVASTVISSDSPNVLHYCYCQQGEYGRMVGCDNKDCPYQWFHLGCLKLKSLPKSSKWYCPDCRKLKKR
jgi:hypothetical protein